MTFGIRIGDKKTILGSSWMERTSLDDLIQALIDLHEGASEARVRMCEEPGTYRLIFTQDEGRIDLRVLYFEMMWTDDPDEAGKVVCEAKCLLRDLSSAMVLTLRRLLDRWGLDGYRKKWKVSEFPLEKYEALCRFG